MERRDQEPGEEKQRPELQIFVAPQNFFLSKKFMLSNDRRKIIENWSHNPASKLEKFRFNVEIHRIPFQFIVNRLSLKEQLTSFFPKEWQLEHRTPIRVHWRSPDPVFWKEEKSPYCFFEGSFTSQRDFIFNTYKENELELMAPEEISDGFFNFLRSTIPLRLLDKGQILFHSSCVLDSKLKPYLFFGPSGAGKTTISKLCQEQGAKILGDDMNILKVEEGQVYVEAAAVGQRFYDPQFFNRSFAIEKAYWLQKATENRVSQLSSNRLGFYLSSFANIFWENISSEQYLKIFKILSEIDKLLELKLLQFKKSKAVWNYVRNK